MQLTTINHLVDLRPYGAPKPVFAFVLPATAPLARQLPAIVKALRAARAPATR